MWGEHMMGEHATRNGVWWGLTSVLFWVVVIALVTAAIVVLIKQVQQAHAFRESGVDPAMKILRERFARGEISGEQFDLMRRTLGERTGLRTENAK